MVEGRLTSQTQPIINAVQRVATELGCAPAQVALRWVAQRPGVGSVLLGARTASQLGDNLGCLDVWLTHDQVAMLDEASKIDLGFPHEFLQSKSVKDLLFGGTNVIAAP